MKQKYDISVKMETKQMHQNSKLLYLGILKSNNRPKYVRSFEKYSTFLIDD